jgi:DNA-binding NarL/FixJ family response regulator
MGAIKVMLVDDHEVVRIGLRAALEPVDDITVVAEAEDAPSAVREAIAACPDVILMDVRLGQIDGIEACRRIRDQLPDTQVVMLTSFGDEETVVASLMAGAAGYVLKNVHREELLKAIRAAAAGESLLDPAVTKGVLARLRSLEGREDPLVASLTGREREVLRLVAKGMTNKEIAEALFIAEPTARNHVSRVFERLGLSRRAEAAAFAIRHRLMEAEG